MTHLVGISNRLLNYYYYIKFCEAAHLYNIVNLKADEQVLKLSHQEYDW